MVREKQKGYRSMKLLYLFFAVSIPLFPMNKRMVVERPMLLCTKCHAAFSTQEALKSHAKASRKCRGTQMGHLALKPVIITINVDEKKQPSND
jgi:hypothetical protein